MVDATCIYFSRPGETVANVFRLARRIYEKYNHPHEWTLDYIGTLISYTPREAILLPDSDFVLGTDMALCWSPSVGAARSRIPSSSTPEATRSSPTPRTGPRSRSWSRVST